jgi:hypothetical protein
VAECSPVGCKSCILCSKVAAGDNWPSVVRLCVLRTRGPGSDRADRKRKTGWWLFLPDGCKEFYDRY